MAGKYQIVCEFSLETRIEPEGVRFHGGDAGEFEDNSNFSDAEVEVYGGEIAFVVEAESEEEAERQAADEIFDGMEAEDDNGFTWVVSGLQVRVEEIVPPMDMARAKELILAFLARVENLDDETKAAFTFVVDELLNP